MSILPTNLRLALPRRLTVIPCKMKAPKVWQMRRQVIFSTDGGGKELSRLRSIKDTYLALNGLGGVHCHHQRWMISPERLRTVVLLEEKVPPMTIIASDQSWGFTLIGWRPMVASNGRRCSSDLHNCSNSWPSCYETGHQAQQQVTTLQQWTWNKTDNKVQH